MSDLDPRALEEAAEAVGRDIHCLSLGHNCTGCRRQAEVAITAYLDVTQPIVETVEGLIALGDGTVIRDKHGDVSEKRGGLWCGYETAPCDAHRMSKYLPARVIWRPHESA